MLAAAAMAGRQEAVLHGGKVRWAARRAGAMGTAGNGPVTMHPLPVLTCLAQGDLPPEVPNPKPGSSCSLKLFCLTY